MYIIDGIAYAGEQQKPIRVKAVRPLTDYRLLVSFTSDEKHYGKKLYLIGYTLIAAHFVGMTAT